MLITMVSYECCNTPTVFYHYTDHKVFSNMLNYVCLICTGVSGYCTAGVGLLCMSYYMDASA